MAKSACSPLPEASPAFSQDQHPELGPGTIEGLLLNEDMAQMPQEYILTRFPRLGVRLFYYPWLFSICIYDNIAPGPDPGSKCF